MTLTRLQVGEQGTSTIEFGLTAPAFFVLVFGIVCIGWLLWTQLGLQHGAEMAARYATINASATNDEVQTKFVQQSYGLNPPSTFTLDRTQACGNRVSASYTVSFFSTYFGRPSLTLTAQSCFPKAS
jgi:Flp pilus assembly protein TadG